jgi:predicted dehydrogenase
MEAVMGGVRVAVIGCGYWGRNLVRNFEALGGLSLVCDATEAGRGLAAKLAPAARVCDDVAAAFESEVDGVVIATPAATHAELVSQAVAAGKDVFVEKPMAMTAAEGRQLVLAAAQRDRILMVGHLLEYHPAFLTLLELVRAGTLGELQAIVSTRRNFGKVARDVNVLWSLNPHDVAMVLRLMGALPVSVSATGGAFVRPHLEDIVTAGLTFKSGAFAQINSCWLSPVKEQSLTVIGDQASVTHDDVAKELTLYENQVEVTADDLSVLHKGASRALEVPGGEPLRAECAAFLEAIATRVPPITDGESGQRVLAVLQAAQESLGGRGAPVVPQA